MADIEYKSNPQLPFIKPNWKGNPHNGKRFFDPNKRFESKFKSFLKWRIEGNSKAKEKKHEIWRLQVQKDKRFLESKEDCIVWLGHATFYLRLGGITMLTDPIFYRISGVVSRLSSLPCDVKDLKNIDYVLLSHGHRDHCDQRSLKELARKNEFEMLTSLNMKKQVGTWLPKTSIQEAGWFQTYLIKDKKLRITFLPAQHWSNRFMWDLNEILWGSFMIEFDGKKLYFGGDSAYCDYPKEIANLFKEVDYAIIGVGAYTPDYMMQDVHTNPYEALKITEDLNAKNFIPMHYGTFDLADEPLGEPYRILSQLAAGKKINTKIHLLDVGEMLLV